MWPVQAGGGFSPDPLKWVWAGKSLPTPVINRLLGNDSFASYELTVDVEVYKDGVSGTS